MERGPETFEGVGRCALASMESGWGTKLSRGGHSSLLRAKLKKFPLLRFLSKFCLSPPLCTLSPSAIPFIESNQYLLSWFLFHLLFGL